MAPVFGWFLGWEWWRSLISGLFFWLVDRFRRRHPQPIVPTVFETPWMFGSYGVLTFAGVTAIFARAIAPG
jgi:hypothetical protein